MSLPPAARPLRCANPDCGFPQGGRCARVAEFPDPGADCPDLTRDASATATPAPPPTDPTSTIGWSGRHLTVREAWGLTRAGPVRLIGVAGPSGTGKTCLLASLFLQLAQGHRTGFPWRFAGCRSLASYRRLVEQAAGWSGRPGDDAVDHTPKAESPDPESFLHLALRPERADDERVVEVLLTDLPGEWFTEWSLEDDAQSRRRLPFLARCDAMLVLLDAETLEGPDRNVRDGVTAQVLRRLGEFAAEQDHQPHVWLVYTKLDRAEDPAPRTGDQAADWGRLGRRSVRTWRAIAALREQGLPVHAVGVAALPGPLADGQPRGVTELFGDVLAALEPEPARRVPDPPPEGAWPMAHLRRERA